MNWFRQLWSAIIRNHVVAPDPAERPARTVSDDTPPPVRVVHFPRRLRREWVCEGCGNVTVEGIEHTCRGPR